MSCSDRGRVSRVKFGQHPRPVLAGQRDAVMNCSPGLATLARLSALVLGQRLAGMAAGHHVVPDRRGSLLRCHGLVMTCAGARVKLAVRLTRSPLATRPEQPCTVKMCKFPPLVFTRWVRSLSVNFTLPSKAPAPVPSITKLHPEPAALISRCLTVPRTTAVLPS